jgi:hypothetical protein
MKMDFGLELDTQLKKLVSEFVSLRNHKGYTSGMDTPFSHRSRKNPDKKNVQISKSHVKFPLEKSAAE